MFFSCLRVRRLFLTHALAGTTLRKRQPATRGRRHPLCATPNRQPALDKKRRSPHHHAPLVILDTRDRCCSLRSSSMAVRASVV